MSITAATVVVCCLAAACGAQPTDLAAVEQRFLFENSSDSSLGIGTGTLLAGFGLLAFGLLGALLLYLLLSGGEEAATGYATATGYSGHSGGDQTSYGHSRGAADTWSTLSAVDWIALAEELYESADELRSRPCQKRLVCQLMRSTDGWTSESARAAAGSALDYLPYLQLLRLPSAAQETLQEYGDAARSGRSAHTDCELLYSGCSLNINSLMDKYAPAASS